MNYQIDDIMLYRSSDGHIQHLHDSDPEPIVLTPVLNRLFDYLLRHQGEVMARETFLHEVWEKYGLEGSTNTLTQYLSNLRKIFDIFFPGRECIITVPRKGYMLASDLLIESEEEPPEKTPIPPALPDTGAAPSPTTPVKPVQNQTRIRLPVVVLVLLLAECLLVYFFRPQAITASGNAAYPVLYTEGHCNVSLITRNVSHADKILAVHYTKKIMADNGLACGENVIFYAGVHAGASFAVQGDVTLSQCMQEEGAPDACITYKYNRW